MYTQSDVASQQPGSPDQDSTEEFEVEDDTTTGQWQSTDQGSQDGKATKNAPPLQKRRRVTRACDECRRKKIKCDGKQPCTHCTVYSYDCTYDQPSNRRRNPAPQYIEALEVRLQRAEALLKNYNPNIDLSDPNLDSLLQHQGASAIDALKAQVAHQKPNPTVADPLQDAQLQSMIESTGQLDIDERGHWDFHGGSSGAIFLRRMREQFGGLLGAEKTGTPFLPRPPRPTMPALGNLDSPRSAYESPHETGLPNTVDLPTKQTALVLTRSALDRGCALLRFVHQPTFYRAMDKIYDTPPESFQDDEHRFLPLLYQVLALGCMFTDEHVELNSPAGTAYKESIEHGLKYFRAARVMVDITDCRDIVSLQCILFMILFLQATSNLSTCYAYIGVALRSAVRMGMHRNISSGFDPIERETRRRIFWITRKMDTYVSALLGFPRMLADEDIDQELPLEVDDEFITAEGVAPMPPGRTSLVAASNAHTKLMTILSKVIKYIYPIKGIEQSTHVESKPTYSVSHIKIREVEQDLQDWLEKLAMPLRPGGDNDEQMLRSQQLLRMAYAHVQMMLYRPFLHYVSSRFNSGKTIDDRSYACAAACVSVSRNIVHICTELKRRGLLVGAYWFTMYTTFFAILSLVFFVLENPDKQGTQEILADAMAGKDALKGLAQRSMAADRCSVALEGLFEKLPEHLKRHSAESGPKPKKRSAPMSAGNQPPRSSPETLTRSHKEPVPFSKSQRASTFPTNISSSIPSSQTTPFDSPSFAASAIDVPNYRRSYHELMSPSLSTVGTPNSSSTGTSIQQPYNYQHAPTSQPFMGDTNLPDLGAMMFPSADPFAYPNQPMMEFDQRLQQNQQGDQKVDPGMFDTGNNNIGRGIPNMYLPNGTPPPGTGPYDNLEGQLFGPLPPYLMQAQGGMSMESSGIDLGGMPGMMGSTIASGGPNNVYGTAQGVGGSMSGGTNFGDIYANNNDDWNNMVGDHGFGG